jgi:hypothetical protein
MKFRLQSDTLEFWVDVRVRSFGDRWIAVADISGDLEVGLGWCMSDALAVALSPLGTEATGVLMADPQLFSDQPSRRSRQYRQTEAT